MWRLVVLLGATRLAGADTYNVVVGTAHHVNVVDRRFLSFTVDPKYLFETEKYRTKECACMAASLSPAYLRVAGPSTDRLVWKNNSITVDDDDGSRLSASYRQWERFARWARGAGFSLVVAVSSGPWERLRTPDVYWQLGYECSNQSIEEYLSDLEALRLAVEGAAGGRVVGGDISPCLRSRSDFKDYVTLANDRTDAILLNGNSSSYELERMSERDRLSLLRLLSQSSTPLWLTETGRAGGELARAADWMTSLGYSARNGFSVHYRELLERELYEPTLSFYMALLFKNLVGERVLSVDVDAAQAVVFAHCTTLRHQPVPGAITLYGVNMEEEPARLSIKLSQTEEGGDVLQFILGLDHNGNIVVNGRPMYYEGDIKPVVRRIRPYKTLLLNLPSKSFGFWVLANTKVEACQNVDNNAEESSQEDKDGVVELVKRSIRNESSLEENSKEDKLKTTTKIRKGDKNKKSNVVKHDRTKNGNLGRVRRDIFNRESRLRDRESIFDNLLSKVNLPLSHGGELIERINQIKEDNLERLRQKKEELSSLVRHNSRRLLKRKPSLDRSGFRHRRKQDSYRQRSKSRKSKSNSKIEKIEDNVSNIEDASEKRDKRSILNEHKQEVLGNKDIISDSKQDKENEIHHIDKILHKVKRIGEIPVKIVAGTDSYDYYDDVLEGLTLKTKISDDSAMVRIEDDSHSGLLKNTLQDIMGLLGDLNKQINRFWSAVTVFN